MIVKMLPKIRYCNSDMFCTVGRKKIDFWYFTSKIYIRF